jgi:hypothetical protein
MIFQHVMQVKNDGRNYLRFLLLDNIRISYYYIHLSILPFEIYLFKALALSQFDEVSFQK